MLILLSCAKTMAAVSKTKVPFCTTPLFQLNATEIALQMTQYSVEELEALLRVNGKIALENYKRYRVFHDHEETALPAIQASTRMIVPMHTKHYGLPRFVTVCCARSIRLRIIVWREM